MQCEAVLIAFLKFEIILVLDIPTVPIQPSLSNDSDRLALHHCFERDDDGRGSIGNLRASSAKIGVGRKVLEVPLSRPQSPASASLHS